LRPNKLNPTNPLILLTSVNLAKNPKNTLILTTTQPIGLFQAQLASGVRSRGSTNNSLMNSSRLTRRS